MTEFNQFPQGERSTEVQTQPMQSVTKPDTIQEKDIKESQV